MNSGFIVGFPFETNFEVKSSPLVVDFDGDGSLEVIFGDKSGFVHVVSNNGVEWNNDLFPFDTGNQVWGAVSGGDVDNDGLTDIAFLSKNKHFYLLDINGVKVDYNA